MPAKYKDLPTVLEKARSKTRSTYEAALANARDEFSDEEETRRATGGSIKGASAKRPGAHNKRHGKNIGPKDLGIKLHDGSGSDYFKWLLACQLFGARISQKIAADTFRLLDERGFTSPDKLAGADWQELVDILGEGGYRRYDESTARELISIGKLMQDKYDGSFDKLMGDADNKQEVKKKVQEFRGVGPKAADIFTREAKL